MLIACTLRSGSSCADYIISLHVCSLKLFLFPDGIILNEKKLIGTTRESATFRHDFAAFIFHIWYIFDSIGLFGAELDAIPDQNRSVSRLMVIYNSH